MDDSLLARVGELVAPRMLPLVVVGDGDPPIRQLYTGFLLEESGLLVWVTAGHCIDQVKAAATTRAINARWHDGDTTSPADSIPIVLESSRLFSLSHVDLDIGFVLLSPYEENLLRARREFACFDAEWCKGVERLRPSELLVGGYPDQEQRIHEGDGDVRFESKGLIFSADELPPTFGDSPLGFWNQPTSLYAQMPDNPEALWLRAPGFSGGPVLRARLEGATIRCWLVAVQRSWLPSQRIVRAERIESLLTLIRAALDSR